MQLPQYGQVLLRHRRLALHRQLWGPPAHVPRRPHAHVPLLRLLLQGVSVQQPWQHSQQVQGVSSRAGFVLLLVLRVSAQPV